MSLRLVRSPAAPKTTITHGPAGLSVELNSSSRLAVAAVAMSPLEKAGEHCRTGSQKPGNILSSFLQQLPHDEGSGSLRLLASVRQATRGRAHLGRIVGSARCV